MKTNVSTVSTPFSAKTPAKRSCRHRDRSGSAGCIAVLFALFCGPVQGWAEDPYHAEIAPLLRVYCAGCHNEDDFEADFSVELFQSLMEGDGRGEVIEPGDGLGSRMIRLMDGRHGKSDAMPPTDEPQPTKDEIATLVAWIDAGAKGPEKDLSILSTLSVPEITSRATVEPITAAAVSPDGKLTARAHFQRVTLSNGVELTDLPGKINALHFSNDGAQLITASGITGLSGVATIWDSASGEKRHEFSEGHRDVLYDAELSPDGTLIATAGYDRRLIVHEVATGKVRHQNRTHNGAIFDLAFGPDGSVLASASGDETVKLWSVETGERIATLPEPEGEQYAVSFTPDGRFLLAGGADNRIRMWRMAAKDSGIRPLIHARFAHEDAVIDLVVSPDGKQLVSSSDDLTIKQWELPSLRLVKSFENQPDVARLTLSETGLQTWRLDGTIGEIALDFAAEAPAIIGTRSQARLTAVTPSKDWAKLTEADETLPGASQVTGKIETVGDTDTFRFSAKAGEQWVAEIEAARVGSSLDSRIEILTADGAPILAQRLQAVRDSWFTFRGKDSKQVNDFRLQNWEEMELNEYLYASGEVTKLWLYPRGPDSGFTVYPGSGERRTYFNTSPVTHSLGEPAYVVRPIAAGEEAAPNGLPIFDLFYDNDDAGDRRYGKDSKILFTAPTDGDYLIRVADVRGEGGSGFDYTLTLRERDPNFTVRLADRKLMVSPGSGKEARFTVTRIDEFEGPVTIDIENLPEGFHVTSPITVEAGQVEASAVIWTDADAPAPGETSLEAITVTTTGTIREIEVTRPVKETFEQLTQGEPAKVTLEILASDGTPILDNLLTIEPGKTIKALVRADRVDFEERIELGKEDSGRNLPHGLYIDNIGLNGLLIVEDQTDREFFISAAPWIEPGTERTFFVRTKAAGGQASRPITIRVVEPANVSLR